MQPLRFFAWVGFLLSCQFAAAQSTSLDWQKQIGKSVFEVVAAKPSEGTISYETPLPSDKLPYSYRQDSQISLGTAFSIGQGRYVSAAHVFGLESPSLLTGIALRDSAGKVWPAGKILAYTNRRDFVVFEVPELEAVPLPMAPAAEINARVFSVGNALGSGVVIREGNLTSMTPEDRDGAWRWLRFSAAASPGNSGGPLLNEAGQVLGIITMRSENENLNYALPMTEVDQTPVADYDIRYRYSLPNIRQDEPFEVKKSVALPLSLSELRKVTEGWYLEGGRGSLSSIVRRPGVRDALDSDKGVPVLDDLHYAELPQIVGEGDDGQWKVNQLGQVTTSRVGKDGTLRYASLWGNTFVHLTKPSDSRSLVMLQKPQEIMDLLLTGLSIYRPYAGQNIRITSLGEPASASNHQDRYGRQWLQCRWELPFSSEAYVLVVTPVPDGFVGFFTGVSIASADLVAADDRALVDFVYLSYGGKLKDWDEYLSLGSWVPTVFRDLSLNWVDGKSFDLASSRWTLKLPPRVINIQPNDQLYLLPSYHRQAGTTVWGLSQFYLAEAGVSKASVSITKLNRPQAVSASGVAQTWESWLRDAYPNDAQVHTDQGATSISAIVHPGTPLEPNPEFLYSLGLRLDGTGFKDAEARSRFSLLSNAFHLTDSEVQRATPEHSAAGTGQAQMDGKTIFQAIANDDRSTLDEFVAADQDLELVNDQGQTPIMAALRQGKDELALALLGAHVRLDRFDHADLCPLILALKYASPKTVRQLVAAGADLDVRDSSGNTPLILAMDAKFGDLPDFLVTRSVDLRAVNTKHQTALMVALINNRKALALDLLHRGSPVDTVQTDGWTALMTSLRYVDSETSLLLIDQGAPIEGTTTDGWTPLSLALRYGQSTVALRLISNTNENIDLAMSSGFTPLLLAAQYGNLDEVTRLIDRGASLYRTDPNGWTPLLMAIRYNRLEVARTLANAMTASVEKNSVGWTPVMMAARYMGSLLPDLERLGIDIQAKSTANYTALHLAVVAGDLNAVRWLIDHKIDLTAKNGEGQTALQIAQANKKPEIVAALLAAQGAE